jgi:hypothetical protein
MCINISFYVLNFRSFVGDVKQLAPFHARRVHMHSHKIWNVSTTTKFFSKVRLKKFIYIKNKVKASLNRYSLMYKIQFDAMFLGKWFKGKIPVWYAIKVYCFDEQI